MKRFLLGFWLKFIKYKKEIATYLLTILGWIILTIGIAEIFGDIVIKLSAGLFLIGISIGYKPLIIHLIYGLYGLSEEE